MKRNTQKGYAILFAVVIVSVISVIAFGFSNSTYKQLVLSSVASDSQLAFFQSDTGTECALYADRVLNVIAPEYADTTFICGHAFKGNKYVVLDVVKSDDQNHFTLRPNGGILSLPCFEADGEKDVSVNPVKTTLKARGYNNCDKSNLRTVEREIKVTY